MTPAELSFFVQVYTSDEMVSATSIEQGLEKIEDALICNADRCSVEEFSRIANSIRYQLGRGEHKCFAKFLVHSAPQVVDWFKTKQIHNVETLVQIVGAYSDSEISDKLPRDFFNMMQHYVLQSAGMLNYFHAVDLVSIMYPYASTELMEVFDRLIGQQHNNLTVNEAFDSLMAFSNAKQARIRPKILQVLFKRLSQDFDRLSTSQLVLLVEVVSNDQDRDLLAKLELNKYLQNQMPSLSISELVTVYNALSHQNDTNIHKLAEEIILNNIHAFRVDSLSDLLYSQSKLRFANK